MSIPVDLPEGGSIDVEDPKIAAIVIKLLGIRSFTVDTMSYPISQMMAGLIVALARVDRLQERVLELEEQQEVRNRVISSEMSERLKEALEGVKGKR